jgi:hypothetical protein
MTLPNSNLPAPAQPWGREIQRRLEAAETYIAAEKVNNRARDKSIANSAGRLDSTSVAVVNTAQSTEVQSSSVVISGNDGAKSNASVVSVTFTKPSWANYCRVACTGTVTSTSTNHASAPITGTMNVSIAGTASQDSGGGTSSNTISTFMDYAPSTGIQTFARSFSPSTTFTVNVLVTKNASVSPAQYKAQILASVTWISI